MAFTFESDLFDALGLPPVPAWAVCWALLLWVLLAFPDGRIESRASRLVAVVVGGWVVLACWSQDWPQTAAGLIVTETAVLWRRSGRDVASDSFPTRVAPRSEGWLLIGARPDGTAVGKDEREALAAVAGSVARALAGAGERATREQWLASAHARIEARLGALEGRPALAAAE